MCALHLVPAHQQGFLLDWRICLNYDPQAVLGNRTGGWVQINLMKPPVDSDKNLGISPRCLPSPSL